MRVAVGTQMLGVDIPFLKAARAARPHLKDSERDSG